MKLDWFIYSIMAPIVAHKGYERYLLDNEYLLQKLFELRVLRGGGKVCFERKKKALEFEAFLYLHTASFAVPFDIHWFRIYSYLFYKYFPQGRNIVENVDRKLDEHERNLLDDLRKWIFKQQIEHLKNKLKNANISQT